MRIIKGKYKIWLFIFTVIILTPILAALLAQVSPVQQFLKERATSYLSEKSGMDVRIGRVKVIFPFYCRMEDLWIRDHHGELMVQSSAVTIMAASYDLRDRVIKVRNFRMSGAYLHQKRYEGEKKDNLSLFIGRLTGRREKKTAEAKPYALKCNRFCITEGKYVSDLASRHNSDPGLDFNHLDISGINGIFTNIALKGEIISLKIEELGFSESSGLGIKSLGALVEISPSSIRLRNLGIETNQTALALDLSFHYQSFKDFSDFEHKVYMRGDFGVSTLSTYDLGFFIPIFFRTNNQLNLKGAIEGFITHFETQHFQFSTGSTSFDGDIVMQGLPDLRNTFINLDINHLVADPSDIERFHLYQQGVISSLPLPGFIQNLGMVSVTGQFNGTYEDFYTNASLTGGFGSVSADMQMTQSKGNFTVNGSVGVEQVDCGKLLNYPDLGMVNMEATVEGSGSLDTWDLDIASTIHSVEYNRYIYQNLDIDGKVFNRMFTGKVTMNDRNIALVFDGILDFNHEIPSYNFVADIKNANLANLHLAGDSLRGLLSTKVSIDVQGNNPDNIAGLVNVEYAEFKTPTRNYLLGQLDLSAFSSPSDRRKLIAIRSDYIEGDIHGNFRFNEISDALEAFSSEYFPGLFTNPMSREEIDSILSGQNEVHFNLTLKNTGNLTHLLTGTRIETRLMNLNGSFVPALNRVRMNGMAENIEFNGRKVNNWYLNVYNGSLGLMLETGARQVYLSDSIIVHEPYLEGDIDDNRINNTISWKLDPANFKPDGLIRNTVDISHFPDFTLTFAEGSVNIRDTLWQIREGSGLSYVNKSLDINNILFYSHDQHIVIDGKAAEKSESAIECKFHKIDLSWLDFFTVPYHVDLDGMIEGEVSVRNLWGKPKILSDLNVSDFAYNRDTLGSVKIISLWDDKVKGMKLSADFIYQGNVGTKKTAGVVGYIYPTEKKDNNFDLAIDMDNFRINILGDLLSDITTDVRGLASGSLQLRGTFREPELTGKLKVNARNILIDYLNTRYSFADSITFTRNAILFDNIELSDNNRLSLKDPYSGVLSGSIAHRGFRDFRLNLNIKADNFTFLNTNGQQDPLYFGRALVTGNVAITGPVEDILITAQVKTERNTLLEIPLITPEEVTKSSFITFIDKEEGTTGFREQVRRLEESNLQMNFNLQVTPDARVKLVFDPLVGDVIEGSGSGNLVMNIDSKGDFDLRGQYVISKGDYMFNLENLISKRFTVRDGGTIRWTGDPYDAIMDIEAVYRTKASLAPLNMEDSALSAQNVDCIIHMTDNLFNPTVTFGIDFPDLTAFDNEKYQALIKPNLNYQFLSLLAISRFVNTRNEQFLESGTSANIAGANTTELLSNQLSVWLSNISDEFDVDFAYHPGITGLTSDQVEAAIKTQVLNDRLTIESKMGIGGRTYAGNTQKTSNMVGDIEAEYRIDKEGRFRVKMYNRYNEQNILYEGAPYTQGIGVFYRKEFNSLKELFRKKDKNTE